MSNRQLQNYIYNRITEHGELVYKVTHKQVSELSHEITETIEEVWERISLGDEKSECFGIVSMCKAVEGIIEARREEKRH
jgi:hypothetical protein